MTAQLRLGDIAWHHSNSNDPQPPHNYDVGSAAAEAVIGAAVLVSAAFRMRDEANLVTSLRELANAVAALERSAPAQDL